jgi:hypothetical protein
MLAALVVASAVFIGVGVYASDHGSRTFGGVLVLMALVTALVSCLVESLHNRS